MSATKTHDSSEGVPSFRGSDWRARAYNNDWAGASPVEVLWDSGKENANLVKKNLT